jgi:hypothetical protein
MSDIRRNRAIRPRKRRLTDLDVTGFPDVDPNLPGWERELLLAAFTQLCAPKSDRRESLPETDYVDPEVYGLVQRLRDDRRFSRRIGRGSARPHVLTHFIRCGRCGASYQLETSGKTVDGSEYRYCYYNCRTFRRTGREACPGLGSALDATCKTLFVGEFADSQTRIALSTKQRMAGLQGVEGASGWTVLPVRTARARVGWHAQSVRSADGSPACRRAGPAQNRALGAKTPCRRRRGVNSVADMLPGRLGTLARFPCHEVRVADREVDPILRTIRRGMGPTAACPRLGRRSVASARDER